MNEKELRRESRVYIAFGVFAFASFLSFAGVSLLAQNAGEAVQSVITMVTTGSILGGGLFALGLKSRSEAKALARTQADKDVGEALRLVSERNESTTSDYSGIFTQEEEVPAHVDSSGHVEEAG